MKKILVDLRDTLVAGLLFMLPLLILLVLVTKAFNMLAGLTSKLAAMFGLKSILGVSGGTIVAGLALILLCFLCGILMRLSLFKLMNKYVDQKLTKHIPGYKVYREMARSKLDPKEETLPFKSAAWIVEHEKIMQPGFILDYISNERYLVFIPDAGNVKEGKLLVLPADKVQPQPGIDMKTFQSAINNQGKGIAVP